MGALAPPTTTLYPGLTVYAPVTVQNTGTVPLALRVTDVVPATGSTALSGSVTAGVAAAVSAAAPTTAQGQSAGFGILLDGLQAQPMTSEVRARERPAAGARERRRPRAS